MTAKRDDVGMWQVAIRHARMIGEYSNDTGGRAERSGAMLRQVAQEFLDDRVPKAK
jgi:hypothetical protein